MAEQASARELVSGTPGLWRHADFLKLWSGQTISLAGSQVTTLALPLTAVLVLHANAFQMGLLQSVQYAPFVLVSIAAGVWADRVRRRSLLISADLGRALLLGTIPALFLLGVHSMEYLYGIAFAVGVLTVVFNVSYQAHLPSLVDREQLVDGNSKLEASRSVTQVVGPGLGGLVVQLLSPPLAIVLDAASFLVSAVSLRAIRRPDPPPGRSGRSVRAELREGFAFIWSHPLVRPMVASSGLVNVSYSLALAVYILFLSHDLGLTPLVLGVVLAAGGAGGLVGAATARRPLRRFGFGPTVTASIVLLGLGTLAVALAGVVPGPPAVVVAAGEAVMAYATILYNVSLFTLWQTTTPARLRGRVSAVLHFIIWGALPFGALIGGALGSLLSLRWTIAIAGIGVLVAAAWIGLSVLGRVAGQEDAAAIGGA
jgi:MFS family permease